jgi:hypothetical protein
MVRGSNNTQKKEEVMKNTILGLMLMVLVAFGTPAAAQDFVAQELATLSVIHGIPGLPLPVDVSVNGAYAFSFDFTDSVGPIDVDAGEYSLAVSLDGVDVLTATVGLEPNANYTAIAHLEEKGGIALSIFENDDSRLSPFESRVEVRHLAAAPAVNVELARLINSSLEEVVQARIKGLTNPNVAGPIEVPSGGYTASLFAEGVGDVPLGTLLLESGVSYVIHAIGEYPETFQLFIQSFDPIREVPTTDR